MLVDRYILNQLYCEIIAKRSIKHPPNVEATEGAVYRSSLLTFKVPRAYFLRHGMTVLREAFEGMQSGESLWNEDDDQFVCLCVARWATIKEGPVLPASGA